MAPENDATLSNPKVMETGIKHLRENDEVLDRLIAAHKPLEFTAQKDYFYSIYESIISQQLTPKAADAILTKVNGLFRNNYPDPHGILSIPDEKLRLQGISWAKVSYLKDFARRITDGELNLSNFDSAPDDKVVEELVKVKGIGVWTAKMFLIFSLGRPDILPWEDLGIRNSIKNLYALEQRPDGDTIRKVAIKWHPYCSIASLYLWRAKDNKTQNPPKRNIP